MDNKERCLYLSLRFRLPFLRYHDLRCRHHLLRRHKLHLLPPRLIRGVLWWGKVYLKGVGVVFRDGFGYGGKGVTFISTGGLVECNHNWEGKGHNSYEFFSI